MKKIGITKVMESTAISSAFPGNFVSNVKFGQLGQGLLQLQGPGL